MDQNVSDPPVCIGKRDPINITMKGNYGTFYIVTSLRHTNYNERGKNLF